MEIEIGTITLGGDSVYQLSSGISGLDSAAIRTGSGLYAGVDGGFVSSQLYGHRTITIQGFFLGDCDEIDAYRRSLISELKIRVQYPIGITTFGGAHYVTSGYITDIKAAVIRPRACEYQITIVCPDPVIYLADDNNPLAPEWTEMSLTEEARTTVTNAGTATVYPTITVTPASSQDEIQFNNYTVVKVMCLDGYGAGSTTPIIFDMQERTILRSSSSLASYRTLTSTWWGLEPGSNTIGYWTAGVTGSSATIRFKTGYQGI